MSFKPIDARRDEFRKYLERTGAMDAISKAFIKLYECPERPDNPIEFLRRNLGDAVLETDTIAHLKSELEDSRNEITQLIRTIGTLKLEQQKTATTADITIKQEANDEATDDTENNETISKSLPNDEPSVAAAPPAVDTKKIESITTTTTTATTTTVVPEVNLVVGGGEDGGGGAEPKPSCSKMIDDQQTTTVVDSTNLPSTSSSSSSTKTEDSTEKTSESEPKQE